ncbi:MAG: hypothetical protein K2X35_14325 [Bryobacteraceae bacterium]|nr:hypothetical protein [Bryobacteraceae bacterium]
MVEFFAQLFGTDFVPHGYCMRWSSGVVGLHVVSDALTALAYFLIPLSLYRFVRLRPNMMFPWMILLFAVFILACGATHVMAIYTLWEPVYRLDGMVKALTAAASLPTAIVLIHMVPKAAKIPSGDELRLMNEELQRQISEREVAEQEVRRLNAHLEQLVAERTAALEAEVREKRETEHRLKEANEDLERFAYAASHDLQEPIRSVSLSAQLLARRYKGKLDPEADRLIGVATEGALRMSGLVRGLLEYAKSSHAEPQSGVADMEAVLQDTLRDLQLGISAAGASITWDALPQVPGSPMLLGRVFHNLISNALKYRSEDPPSIHVSVAKDESGWIFTVEDNGIGIEPEHSEKIFDVFTRLHGRERSGYGLGLALAKRVIERHGGQIWVESEPGSGSRFRFRLPDRPLVSDIVG